jgi:lipoate-protein ligase A
MDVWRWMDSGPGDGAWHMALDRAMLDLVCDVGRPTFRVYRWQPWCVSLGFHQSETTMDKDRLKERGIDLVRRPTGGRAVFHAEELTYGVVLPSVSWAGRTSIEEFHRLISEGLCRGLEALGLSASLEKRSPDLRAHYRTPLSASCFSAAARHEIEIEGKKIVGSAQRRTQTGILQHGSILLGEAHADLPDFFAGIDPDERERMKQSIRNRTATIRGHTGRQVTAKEAADRIRKGMEEVLGIRFETSEPNEEEKRLARELKPSFLLFSGGGS